MRWGVTAGIFVFGWMSFDHKVGVVLHRRWEEAHPREQMFPPPLIAMRSSVAAPVIDWESWYWERQMSCIEFMSGRCGLSGVFTSTGTFPSFSGLSYIRDCMMKWLQPFLCLFPIGQPASFPLRGQGSDVTPPPPLWEGLPGTLGAERHPSYRPPQRRSQS